MHLGHSGICREVDTMCSSPTGCPMGLGTPTLPLLPTAPFGRQALPCLPATCDGDGTLILCAGRGERKITPESVALSLCERTQASLCPCTLIGLQSPGLASNTTFSSLQHAEVWKDAFLPCGFPLVVSSEQQEQCTGKKCLRRVLCDVCVWVEVAV